MAITYTAPSQGPCATANIAEVNVRQKKWDLARQAVADGAWNGDIPVKALVPRIAVQTPKKHCSVNIIFRNKRMKSKLSL